MNIKAFFAVFFIILILIFSVQNAEITDVKFLFWKLSISKVLIILGSFTVGILVGILISLKKRYIKKINNG